MNTFDRVIILAIVLFAGASSVDLLNYKDWLYFFSGIAILVACTYIALKLLYTILKKIEL